MQYLFFYLKFNLIFFFKLTLGVHPKITFGGYNGCSLGDSHL